ncbi:biotin synthase BioB [Brachybacterium sp. DNPG3]
MRWHALVDRIADGHRIEEAEALAALRVADEELLDLVAAASRLRRAAFGDQVTLNYLVSLKSGLCPEDCGYCSQAFGSAAPILKYSWLDPEEAVRQAQAGIAGGAARVCLVASGRGPMDRDVERVAGIATALKEQHPGVEVCACLGLLGDGQAERLVEAGVDAYNHNINTAESHHEQIVRTHTYADRIATIDRAKQAGASPCSGLIVGMGESDEQVVEALLALRDLEVDSLPINFLVPFDGTPMQGRWTLTPGRCLRIVALARLVHPCTEIRLAGGRELHLRGLQGLALHLANSIFLGDYLTAEGQAATADLELIRDAGFVPRDPSAAGRPHGTEAADGTGPTVRRRGAGTGEAANA